MKNQEKRKVNVRVEVYEKFGAKFAKLSSDINICNAASTRSHVEDILRIGWFEEICHRVDPIP